MKNAFNSSFFDIPIYRCSQDGFLAERQKDLDEFLERVVDRNMLPEEKAPEIRASMKRQFLDRYGLWQYNEIVGWLRLFVLGRQLRGEIWFVDSKRVRRKSKVKKHIVFVGKAFELTIEKNCKDKEIIAKLNWELKNIKRDKPIKNRYLDLELFNNIAPHINWHSLLGY